MRKIILILFLLGLVVTRTSAQSTRDTSVVMCSGDSATMSATFSNADSLQWFKNDFAIFGANNDTFVTYESGNYYVVAYRADCSDESGDILVKISMPTVMDDHFMFGLARTETLAILENDQPACAPFDLTTLQIVTPPKFGSIVSLVNGRVMYRSAVTEIESDQFSYRIRDVEGRLSNIGTVFIDIDFNCGLVYPNPVGAELNVVVNPQRIHAMNLYDAHGKLLYSSDVTQINQKINMGAYAQGIYMLEFLERNGPGCKIKVQKTL